MIEDTVVRLPQQRVTGSAPARTDGREHRYDVDLLRLVCSATIMVGHVGALFIHATGNDPANGAGSYWAGHVAEAVNPFAVPVYFAIAGWAVLVGAPHATARTCRGGSSATLCRSSCGRASTWCGPGCATATSGP
ncbi:hypothetical protein ACFQZ0_23435 [Streptomyces erythrogriseus]